MRVLVALIVAAASLAAQQPPAQIPALLRLPTVLPPDVMYELGTARLALVKRSQALSDAARGFNGTCAKGPDTDAACARTKADLLKETIDYSEAARLFNEKVALQKTLTLIDSLNFGVGWTYKTEPPTVRRTVDSMFIGGTGWVYGFVRRGDPKLNREAEATFARNAKTSSGSLDLADYDMVIAVASSGDLVYDLVDRVIGVPFSASDQATLGAYSAAAQPLYASLRGTAAANLDCHSNGAMICLHALSSGDILPVKDSAGKSTLDVRLYGPQITPAAVQKWRSLISEGKVRSIAITLNEGDPIGPASYAVGDSPWTSAAVRVAKVVNALSQGKADLSAVDFFSPKAAADLRARIMEDAPGIVVTVDSIQECRQQLAVAALHASPGGLFACHDMRLYQSRRR
jgi:hypothetical protein